MNNIFGNNNSFKEYLEKEQEKMVQQQEKADREVNLYLLSVYSVGA